MATQTLTAVTVQNQLTIAETVSTTDTAYGSVSGSVVAGQTWRMDGTTGPSITKEWHGTVTLAAGVKTLNLAALVDALLGTVDMTGLKLKLVHITAPSTNTAVITIVPGASNGYTSLGLGLRIGIGDSQGPLIMNGAIAVDATHKNLDFAGTGAETLYMVLGFGS